MQVHYYLLPAEGKPFNVSVIQAELQRLPGSFRLPRSPDLSYVIAASAGMARFLEAQLTQRSSVSLATQGFVTLSPDCITIRQDAPREILTQMEPWVTWLMRDTPCRVLSEEGEDWTHHYGHNPHGLFVEEDTWS
jgi:hypothetical protein